MTVELGRFADLRIPLPWGQKVLLVDTRTYYMKYGDGEIRGEGLILHHDDLSQFVKRQQTLPHVDDALVKQLRNAKSQWTTDASDQDIDNVLEGIYHDPLVTEQDTHWLAAFAPVILSARTETADVYDTSLFVIVQQQQ